MSVISTKDKKKVITVTANGQEITGETIEEWCNAYEEGRLPDGYEPTGEIVRGRPALYGDKMASITVRVPLIQKVALEREATDSGVSLSSYVRNIIALRQGKELSSGPLKL